MNGALGKITPFFNLSLYPVTALGVPLSIGKTVAKWSTFSILIEIFSASLNNPLSFEAIINDVTFPSHISNSLNENCSPLKYNLFLTSSGSIPSSRFK
ncbi:MAG: hypothetical protein MI784_12150, partial [Cytophagales bacterium]|nr:hypothetical protein [Cytophagales bacterium]